MTWEHLVLPQVLAGSCFSSQNNSPIWILMRKKQITLDWNFCFDVFLTVKKSIHFAKKERKTEKLFPAWFLCTVNTCNIRCDSCFVKEMRKKKGSWGDWCFDLSSTNTLEENTFLHPDHQSCQLWECWQLLFPTTLFNKSRDGNLFFERFLMSWCCSNGGQERRGNALAASLRRKRHRSAWAWKKKETRDGLVPTTDLLNWDR